MMARDHQAGIAMKRVAVALLFVFLPGLSAAHAQQSDAIESAISAAAQPTYSLDTPPKPNRLDFDFRADETKAWINRDGDFQVQGWIKHNGLLCGTYGMGLRFGIGAPGCLNVKWLGDPVFVTQQVQCNNARTSHLGGDNSPDFGARVGEITCAERVIRCTGNCK